MTTNLIFEFMDASNAWQDRTTDVKHCSISSVGLVGQRYAYPQTGRAVVTMNNQSGNYGPASTGIGSGRLDNRRRVRVRDANTNLGNKLTAAVSGNGAATVSTTGSTSSGVAVQNVDIYSQRVLMPGDGVVQSFTFTFNGTATAASAPWAIYRDNGGSPGKPTGSALASGTFVPVTSPGGNITMTIALSTPLFFTSGTIFHVVWGNPVIGLWGLAIWQPLQGNPYKILVSTDNGSTWGELDEAAKLTVTVLANSYFEQTVSNSSTIGDTFVLQWDAKAAFDSQYNQDIVFLKTNAETGATSLKSYTTKWKTYSISFTTTANGTSIIAHFMENYSSTVASSAAIDYRNVTLKKNGGANLLTNGDFSSGAVSPWTGTAVSPTTISLSVSRDSYILYNGFIEKIYSSHGQFGDLQTVVNCVDWVEILKLQNIMPTLQENIDADALITYALSFLTPATFNATPPGKLLDNGLTIISEALDGIAQNTLSILQVCTDAAISEYGRFYVDRDGTIRFRNRWFLPYFQRTATALTLADGQAWAASDGEPQRDISTIINSALITYHPRNTTGAQTVLGNAAAGGAIKVPGITPSGVAGQTTITITYRDNSTGKYIGGKSLVTPLVATTDYLVNDRPDGTGFNYTATSYFSITNPIFGATQTTLTLNNTASGPLYVTLLQVRGIPVTHYDPVQFKQSDATSVSTYQERTYNKDLQYANDQDFAQGLSDLLIKQYKYPFAQFGGVKILEKDSINGVDLTSLELFDIVSVASSQPNLSAIKHFICGVNYELEPDSAAQVQSVEFNLERFDFNTFFILEDTTYGRLNAAGNGLYI